jgi:EpsD family peptidyl-prolyl cis-trans isomerase
MMKWTTTAGVAFHPFFARVRRYEKKALMQNFFSRLPVCLLAISIVLVSCGKTGAKTEASQVAAKVNGAEISVHQINQVLEHTPGVTAENADAARKEILERLIVQELAVAKATDSKLDRTPEIIMALDAARKDILAQAYFNQVAGNTAKVSDTEVKHYFNEHPELFSQRRIYTLKDVAIQRDEKLMALLQDMVARNKSIREITQWLEEHGTSFKADTKTRTAEQLSLEILPRIAKLKDDQSEIFEAGPLVHVINLVNSRPEPVDMATASPQIEQFLVTQRRQQLISGELKTLRDSAKVEYLGEFAPDKSRGTSTPSAAPPAVGGDARLK